MAEVQYSTRSLYAQTPILGRYLGYFVDRRIPEHELDALFPVRDQRYVHAPDNLAFDLYGTAEYWWVFGRRNNLQDPVFDIELGTVLIIPDGNYLRTILG